MSTEPFIGEVKIFAFNFAPDGYLQCNGQLLPISSYNALYALIGTFYGGDGRVNFALPDLRGRFPINQGQGNGMPAYQIGNTGGANSTTLLSTNMPIHNHIAQGITVKVPVSAGGGDTSEPNGAYLAVGNGDVYSSVATVNNNYGNVIVDGATSPSGGSLPFSIQNPYLVLNYSIATTGIFPTRP